MDIQNQPSEFKSYPFYIKVPVILLTLILVFYILYILSPVLVPFAFACLLAILLNPLSTRLERKLPRGLAIFCAIIIALVIVCTLIFFLSRQIASFIEAMPALKAKYFIIASQAEHWISRQFEIGRASCR